MFGLAVMVDAAGVSLHLAELVELADSGESGESGELVADGAPSVDWSGRRDRIKFTTVHGGHIYLNKILILFVSR